MKATIQDIAQQLNVSTATVSRSLRQDPAIHPRTRARVAEAAIRLGYEGRTQRGSRTIARKRAIGVCMLVGESPNWSLHENVVRMLHGISEECDRLDMSLMLNTIGNSKGGKMATNPEVVPNCLQDHSVDAMLLTGPHHLDDVRFIVDRVPTVTLSWLFKGIETDAVVLDNIEGIMAQVEKLAAAGHRRLCWVHEQYEASFFFSRHCGFLQGCLAHGLNLSEQREVYPGPQTEARPLQHEDFRALLESGVTAFVCPNDALARYVIKELVQQGLRVPEDASVTGFDAMAQPDSSDQVLDSVNPHFEDVGRDAVRLAVRRIENPTARTALMTVRSTVVDGQTIRALT